MEGAADRGGCYTCGAQDHMSRNCPQKAPSAGAWYEALSRRA